MAYKNPNVVDWEEIEKHYREGIFSVKQIADIHKVSHVAVLKRAKVQNWKRSLKEKIKREYKRREVLEPARDVVKPVEGKPKPQREPIDEREIIDQATDRCIQVTRDHKRLIGRNTRLVENFIQELENGTTKNITPRDKANILVCLSNTTRTLVTLERQVFGISDEVDDKKNIIVELVGAYN
jgi:hypothetical protein